MDHCLLAQLVGRPGHAPAVVAVSGGEEGRLTEFLAEGLAGKVVVGHLTHVPAHLLGDVAGHGKGAAQHLEGIQAKTVGLVLNKEAPQAQVLCHAVQAGQRCDGILGKAAVEGTRFRHILKGHDGKLPVVAPGHLIRGPLDRLSHVAHLSPDFKNFLAVQTFCLFV